MKAIDEVNADSGIQGCLMFRPLPKGYDEEAACEALDPRKDIDGIGRAALARVFTGRGEGFAPCTAAACLEMLDGYDVSIEGKRVVVVGRSLVIGRPVAMMLLERNATVTLCHSRTANLPSVMRDADIVVWPRAAQRRTVPIVSARGKSSLTSESMWMQTGIFAAMPISKRLRPFLASMVPSRPFLAASAA